MHGSGKVQDCVWDQNIFVYAYTVWKVKTLVTNIQDPEIEYPIGPC